VLSVQRSGFVVNGVCGFKVKSGLTTKGEEVRPKHKTQIPYLFLNLVKVFFVSSVQCSGFVVNGFCGFKFKSGLNHEGTKGEEVRTKT